MAFSDWTMLLVEIERLIGGACQREGRMCGEHHPEARLRDASSEFLEGHRRLARRRW
jgi:hypothetical protein